MTTATNHLDIAMTSLLVSGHPMPLGLKYELIVERMTRLEYPATADQLLGSAADIRGESAEPNYTLLSQYKDLRGYQFSWGMLTESICDDDGFDDDLGPCLSFEVIPEELLKKYWRSDIWDRVLTALYRAHELEHPEFDVDEGSHSECVMEFRAFGDDEGRELRLWMANVFIPKILPDLLAAADRLLAIREKSEEELDRICGELEVYGMSPLQMAYAANPVPIPLPA